MKRSYAIASTALFLVVGVSLWIPNAIAEEKASPRLQHIADQAEWEWDERSASPIQSIRNAASLGYHVRLDVIPSDRHSPDWTYSILRDDAAIHSWPGHESTIFQIHEDRLYLAQFSRISTGATIVAIDLLNGRQLWSRNLHGIGPILHSLYRNRLSMSVSKNLSALEIWGDESGGRYLEYLDLKSGQAVGHRIFERHLGKQP